MLSVPAYKTELINTFCQWVTYDFNNAVLDPKIDSLANAIRADVYADTKKFFTSVDFDNNLTISVGPIIGIKPFISNRRTALQTELYYNGCIAGVNETNASGNTILIYPNPAENYVTIEFNPNEKENTIHIFNALGQEVFAEISKDRSETINTSELQSGIYYVNVNNTSFGQLTIVK
jgi:hypothetical protein